MFRALRAHHQEVEIALHSLWYHHTETSEWSYRWPSRALKQVSGPIRGRLVHTCARDGHL